MNQNFNNAWEKLQNHGDRLGNIHLRELFAAEPGRAESLSLSDDGMLLDYSKNRITAETLDLLQELARTADIPGRIQAMFHGEKINWTEKRAVLHTALRGSGEITGIPGGKEIPEEINRVRERMASISEAVRRGTRRGITGKPFRHVVHIGIGGSSLPLQAALEALRPYARPDLNIHLLSNIDGAMLKEIWSELDLEATLFIIASKTFTTEETMVNARTIKERISRDFEWSEFAGSHLSAVTASPDKAVEFGIPRDNILPTWEWVGGRFSLCSAVGLALMIAVGSDAFHEMLKGFSAMDRHFLSRTLNENMPVILALLGIWNINVLGMRSLCILPYDYRLRSFPAYIQEVDMESNGKSTGREGTALERATAPVVWGGVGTDTQHAFFQMLHQGTHIVPGDFILVSNPHHEMADHHRRLLANGIAQCAALAFGKTFEEAEAEGSPAELLPYKVFPGNRPSNTLLIERLTPYNYGRLAALYEHKIACQGWIWNINSFDQYGVELGKVLAKKMLPLIEGKDLEAGGIDSSSRLLIRFLHGAESG